MVLCMRCHMLCVAALNVAMRTENYMWYEYAQDMGRHSQTHTIANCNLYDYEPYASWAGTLDPAILRVIDN